MLFYLMYSVYFKFIKFVILFILDLRIFMWIKNLLLLFLLLFWVSIVSSEVFILILNAYKFFFYLTTVKINCITCEFYCE